MFPSRKISITFAAVFFIGVAVGALVMWDLIYVKPDKSDVEISLFMARTNDPVDAIVKRINDKYVNVYHFSPEEVQKVQPFVEELARAISDARHGFSTQILSTMDSSHQKIAAQLSPEHRAVFEQAIADRQKQLTVLLLEKNSATPSP